MTTSSIVFTFIGIDEPGLVEKLSRTVSENGGNWLESNMSQLAGQFAGITRVQIDSASSETLRSALLALNSDKLTVVVQIGSESAGSATTHHSLHVIGNDRPGVVREITAALSVRGINVVKMHTSLTSAPMTAEALFEATAQIAIGYDVDMLELQESLDDIARDLAVDIVLN